MSTKSNRSSGTQINQRGVTQGVTLVDPKTGLPVDVKTDINGVKRLAVDAAITLDTVTINIDDLNPQDDGVRIQDPANNNILHINSDGSIDANVTVDASDGDNIALASPDGSKKVDVSTIDGKNSLNVNTINQAYTIRKDIVDNITYIGRADPNSATSSPKWRITRTEKLLNNVTGNEDEITLTAGAGDFDQIWDNRSTLFPSATQISFFGRRFERLLPVLTNANWLKLGNFDRVVPSFTDDYIQMDYFESGNNIARSTIRYINELDWQIDLKAYINNDDGSLLQDDDSTELLLD